MKYLNFYIKLSLTKLEFDFNINSQGIKMSKNLGYSCLALTMIANLNLQAENLANPKEITPLKQFSPPPLINPNITLGYYLENRFDRTFRTSYYRVTDIIDKSLDLFHISGGYFDHKKL